ncbi:MAG: SGNH/GDSL hydrolase family protein [Clostridia bacterium]|nr:SGNH/GDSL hydrolase family protein [Clostridia bacterium]
MKIRLSIYPLALILVFTLASCEHRPPFKADEFINTVYQSDPTLGVTEDMGAEYIDSLIFIGESTTYHMKDRAVLSGGKNTHQIWMPKSGTMTLDAGVAKQKILYPETGELISFSDAAARSRPKIIIMTFGLNGAPANIRLGEDYFKSCYKRLISALSSASPETRIILQSAPPIAKSMDMKSYTVDAATLSGYIDKINSWTLSLCEELGLKYLNSSEVLKDSEGFLIPEFDAGDGHHLTKAAYETMLLYIRTHGYR